METIINFEDNYKVFRGDNMLFDGTKKECDDFWDKNYIKGTQMYVLHPAGFVAMETDDLPF